jgi:hypothetical protein
MLPAVKYSLSLNGIGDLDILNFVLLFWQKQLYYSEKKKNFLIKC